MFGEEFLRRGKRDSILKLIYIDLNWEIEFNIFVMNFFLLCFYVFMFIMFFGELLKIFMNLFGKRILSNFRNLFL